MIEGLKVDSVNKVVVDMQPKMSTKLFRILVSCMGAITIFMLIKLNFKMFTVNMTLYEVEREWYYPRDVPCDYPKTKMDKMRSLAIDASSALNTLGVPSVACFGTLIGVLRSGDVLPWDSNVDLCIVHHIPVDMQSIKHSFMNFNIHIQSYDYLRGHFKFTRDGVEGFVTVFTECSYLAQLIFKHNSYDDYTKVGVHSMDVKEEVHRREESSLLCPDGYWPYASQLIHGKTKPFPAHLLRPPYTSLSFGSKSIQVPNEDSAILKYLYPDSWWIEVKPCYTAKQHS